MSNPTHCVGGVLLAATLAFTSACETPFGPTGLVFKPDFATQSTLTHLTLSRGDTTLVSASGAGAFRATSPVSTHHRLAFHLDFPPDAPVSHQVYLEVIDDVSLYSEREGTRTDSRFYETGRGAAGADYELSFVSGKTSGTHTIRITVEESAGKGSGIALAATVTIHLTLEAPLSDFQSDLLFLDLKAYDEDDDYHDGQTLFVTTESGVFNVTSTVNTKLSLRYEVFLAPEAEIHRRVFITVIENYSTAAARESTPNSFVTRHQTGWSGSKSTGLAILGEHFRSRSTPGIYRAHLKVEESGEGLPGKTLVDEVIIHLTLEP